MAKQIKKHMSVEEFIEWDNLYNYVRFDVMGYDKNQSLSKSMVLRLKGLLNNKFMANNNIKDTANYSYKTVLSTFKYCMPNIKRGLSNNVFNDENHKFAYILKIVESNLNTVYLKMRNAENEKGKSKMVDEHIEGNVCSYIEYNHKDEEVKLNKNKYKDLW